MYLNIRQKVILGFAACVLAIGFIGGFSYHYLHAIELKQHVVQIADDLREIVLETRRYEKNFLLYGQDEDFKQNQAYSPKSPGGSGQDHGRCQEPESGFPDGYL